MAYRRFREVHTPATLATVATFQDVMPKVSQTSQLSQPIKPPPVDQTVASVATVARVVEPDIDAIEERAALCAECIPARYLDGWSRLNHQRPTTVTEEQWRQALDGGGIFIDAWGSSASELGWSPNDLFAIPRNGSRGGLIWHLRGRKVEALGADHARFNYGEIFNLENDNA